jgi:hypothetical protein
MLNSDNTINYIPPEGDGTFEEPQVAPINTTDKPTKDFKKILGKGSKEGKDDQKKKSPTSIFSEEQVLTSDISTEETGISSNKEDSEKASDGIASIFDLSKKPEIKDFDSSEKSPMASTAKVESPNDLFKRMSSPRLAKTEMGQKQEVQTSKNRLLTTYSSEQMDLSYVNPLALQAQIPAITAPSPVENVQPQRPVGMDPNLALLIEQIVKQMYTVEKSGQTDTVMIIDYPPLFKDAKITVTSFESAKGQFNISIDNLTQQAQKILESDKNKKSLLNELEQKGYTVQMFTTSTLKIENIALPEQQSSHDRDQQREGGSSKHRRDEDED